MDNSLDPIGIWALNNKTRFGCFHKVSYELEHLRVHKLMFYLSIHPNKSLTFQKSPSSEEIKIREHLSTNLTEDFTFQNTLESCQYLE